MAFRGMCNYVGIWGERNDRVFRGKDRYTSQISCVPSVLVSVSKLFCSYALGNINLSWIPSL